VLLNNTAFCACVGAGLLANAACHSMHSVLIHRFREQARSHI